MSRRAAIEVAGIVALIGLAAWLIGAPRSYQRPAAPIIDVAITVTGEAPALSVLFSRIILADFRGGWTARLASIATDVTAPGCAGSGVADYARAEPKTQSFSLSAFVGVDACDPPLGGWYVERCWHVLGDYHRFTCARSAPFLVVEAPAPSKGPHYP